jgi:hypothetical protein
MINNIDAGLYYKLSNGENKINHITIVTNSRIKNRIVRSIF